MSRTAFRSRYFPNGIIVYMDWRTIISEFKKFRLMAMAELEDKRYGARLTTDMDTIRIDWITADSNTEQDVRMNWQTRTAKSRTL